MMKKWESIVKLNFPIKLLEGTAVRGSGGDLKIGAIVEPNLAVIRDPVKGDFYIPGSSLKGKLRSVLEKEKGKENQNFPGEPCGCGDATCKICLIFGAHKYQNKEVPIPPSAPTRIVVRDAHLSAASMKTLADRRAGSQPILEIKTENTVNRRGGAAKNPRTGERVLRDTVFDGEIILHIYEGDDAADLTKHVRHGLGIIQEASSIGASGSRGYGKVHFGPITGEEPIPLANLKI